MRKGEQQHAAAAAKYTMPRSLHEYEMSSPILVFKDFATPRYERV
jgi:hypothetical protein